MEACNPPTIQDSNETQFIKGLREFRALYGEMQRDRSNHERVQPQHDNKIAWRHCRTCRNLRRNFRNACQEMVDLAIGASDTCPICQQEYNVKNVIFSLPCIHTFHMECFLQWKTDHVTCPLCMLDCDSSYLDIGSQVSRGRLRYIMKRSFITYH